MTVFVITSTWQSFILYGCNCKILPM